MCEDKHYHDAWQTGYWTGAEFASRMLLTYIQKNKPDSSKIEEVLQKMINAFEGESNVEN